jgi:hypothetical protein
MGLKKDRVVGMVCTAVYLCFLSYSLKEAQGILWIDPGSTGLLLIFSSGSVEEDGKGLCYYIDSRRIQDQDGFREENKIELEAKW